MDAMVADGTVLSSPVHPDSLTPGHDSRHVSSKRRRVEPTVSTISEESLKEALVAAFTTSHTLNLREMELRMGRIPKKSKLDETDLDEPEPPVLIHIENHTIKDDAHKVIDFVARSVRPLQCDQTVWWTQQKRVSRPVKEDLEDSHLTASSVNPRTVARLHDRGAEINNKMFLSRYIFVFLADCTFLSQQCGC
jgi:hypothetical protein